MFMPEGLSLDFIEELPEVERVSDQEVADIMAQLKERPGEWALVRRDAHEGFHKRFPGADCYRVPLGKGRYDIFLRWLEAGMTRPIRPLTWEEPPTFPANDMEKRREADEIVEQLKARPGQWAIVEKFEGTTNHSRRKKWKDRGVEVASRAQGKFAVIYARWPENA